MVLISSFLVAQIIAVGTGRIHKFAPVPVSLFISIDISLQNSFTMI